MTPFEMALEHVAWAQERGLTASQVAEGLDPRLAGVRIGWDTVISMLTTYGTAWGFRMHRAPVRARRLHLVA